MESKRPDDTLRMRRMIWICTYCICSKALFRLTWPTCRCYSGSCCLESYFPTPYFPHEVQSSKNNLKRKSFGETKRTKQSARLAFCIRRIHIKIIRRGVPLKKKKKKKKKKNTHTHTQQKALLAFTIRCGHLKIVRTGVPCEEKAEQK